MIFVEMQVKWSVTLTDRLGPEILTVLEIKGQVLHRVRLHVKVPGWLLNLNALLTKKLPKFLSRLNEMNGGRENMCLVSGSLRRILKFLRMSVNSVGDNFLFSVPCRNEEEKREMVKHVKDAIKRSMKAGVNLAAMSGVRSPSFRRTSTEDRLNCSDPGPQFRVTNDSAGMFRRSLSHNPEEVLKRRISLESDVTHSSVDSNRDWDSVDGATIRERRLSSRKNNIALPPIGADNQMPVV